jgi:short subunit dehydrogenase-like uncharacterized protein
LEERRKERKINDAGTAEIFVADSSDIDDLTTMATTQSRVVIACACPFARYDANVVLAEYAMTGTDYVDINGDVFFWVAQMRQQFGEVPMKSGSRIGRFAVRF